MVKSKTSGGVSGECSARKFFFIRFSKMQFPEFSGSELVNWEGIENAHKR